VLVVDDDAVVRTMARELLRVCGCDVVDIGVPERVAAVFDAQPAPVIDCLFVDVSMPHVSGPQLIEQLGARIHGISLVFMTGETDPGLATELRRTFGAEVLHKPFTLNDLRAVLPPRAAGARQA